VAGDGQRHEQRETDEQTGRRNEALRRDFHAALNERDWRYGITGGAPDFFRMVTESPALVTRIRQMHELREEYLAQVPADETDADPDDPTPRLMAHSWWRQRQAGPGSAIDHARRPVV
jgi:hypothetical protein